MSLDREHDGSATLIMKVQSASGLAKKDLLGTSDPYVRASLMDSGQNIVHEQKTKHVKKSLNPVWNEVFTFSNVNPAKDKLLLRVFDQNRVTRDDFLGQISLNLKDINIQHLEDIEVAQKYSLPLKNKPGKHRSGVKGKLYISLCYKPDPRAPNLGANLSVNLDSAATRVSTLSIAENGTQDEDEDTLPQGWEARVDSVGRTYYIDHTNKVTQWEHPRVTLARYSAGVRPIDTPSIRRQRMQTMPRRQLSETSDGPRNARSEEAENSVDGETQQTPEDSTPTNTPSPLLTQTTTTPILVPILLPVPVPTPSPAPATPQQNTNGSSAVQATTDTNTSVSSSSTRARDTRDRTNDTLLANLSSTLAPGWEARYAPNGRIFFIDHNSRQTAWVHPVTGQNYPSNRPSQTESPSPARQSIKADPLAPNIRKPLSVTDHPLPPGWEMRLHQNRPFFINHNNRATQWEDPRVFGSRSGGAVPYNRDYKRKYETLMKNLPPKLGPPAKLDLPVKRSSILDDSYRDIINLKNLSLMRSRLYVKFDDEKGLDYGGLAREWFMLLSHEMFNPYYCLFEYAANDTYTLQINPNSGFCNEHHLHYFRFIGRVCAMAVYHQKLIDAFFIRPFYKLLVDKPIKIEDMEIVDPEYHNSLQYVLENDPEDLELYFTTEEESFGEVKTFPLKKDGESIQVTNANKKEYVGLIIKHRFENRIKDQLKAFKEGFSDVFPIVSLKIFDEKELEYLMCGLAEIDTLDWRNNTDYRHYSPKDQVIQWFWQVVASYDNEMRARLLQFATGTSRLPMNGFAELYGSNGPQKFCLSKVGLPDNLPVAHTCFNRIDLPPYRTYNDLKEKVTYAIENTGGFNID